MKEVVFWKANDVQVGTEKLPIFQDEADCLVKAIFPGKNIHDLCKEFEFSENVHFSGEIRIIPDTAIRFNGYLLDKDEPSYAFWSTARKITRKSKYWLGTTNIPIFETYGHQ
jgi:hypothetical protein